MSTMHSVSLRRRLLRALLALAAAIAAPWAVRRTRRLTERAGWILGDHDS